MSREATCGPGEPAAARRPLRSGGLRRPPGSAAGAAALRRRGRVGRWFSTGAACAWSRSPAPRATRCWPPTARPGGGSPPTSAAGWRRGAAGRLRIRRNLHLALGVLTATSGLTGPGRPVRQARAHARGVAVDDAGRRGRGGRAHPRARSDQGVAAADAARARALVPRDRARPARLRRLDQADRQALRPAVLRARRARAARRARDRARALRRQQPRRPRRAGDGPAPSRPHRAPRSAVPVAGLAAATPVDAAAAPAAPRARPDPARAPANGRAARALADPGRATRPGSRSPSTSSCASTSTRAGARRCTRPRARSRSRSPRAGPGSGHGCARWSPDALFVWGRRDRLVPVAFAEPVREALPRARHLDRSTAATCPSSRPRARPTRR